MCAVVRVQFSAKLVNECSIALGGLEAEGYREGTVSQKSSIELRLVLFFGDML